MKYHNQYGLLRVFNGELVRAKTTRMTQREKSETELKIADLPRLEPEETEGLQFPESLIVLAKRKALILWFVGFATALGVLYCLLWPNSYTANAKIMPPQQNQSMAALSMINQLGSLGTLAGQNLGLRTPSDLYIGMLHSRTVADNLVEHFKLMSVYKCKRRVDARDRLESLTTISTGKDGVISLSVQDRDVQRAADLANAYVDELEKLTKTLAVSEAGKRRIFFEREVRTASADLANAEVALKETQQKTGLILLDSQSRAMIESYTALQARVAAQEVQVRSMKSFATEENPELVRAEQELAALRTQLLQLTEGGGGKRSFSDVPIENVPTAGLEYVRKLREVKYREALFELLAKQYEAAKLDEARDSFVVQQLDWAERPEKRSWPKPAIVLPLSVLAGIMLGIFVALFLENFAKAKTDGEFLARLNLFRFYLRGEPKG